MTPIMKRILCLANSRKLSGRCVVGKLYSKDVPGAWIRPVSNREAEELRPEDYRYKDGQDPCVLEVIDVPLKSYRPKEHQSENWLIDSGYYWGLAGRIDYDKLPDYLDHPSTLWINGSSTQVGANDRVKASEAKRLRGSIYLIQPEYLTLIACESYMDYGIRRRRVQADFGYEGSNYKLWVTDPSVESEFSAYDTGHSQDVPECVLTISLAEPYHSHCYKLVAAVITPEDEIW